MMVLIICWLNFLVISPDAELVMVKMELDGCWSRNDMDDFLNAAVYYFKSR